MRLTISQTDLSNLVARGTSSAPKNSPAEIANHARLIAKNGHLEVASTDFERMVEIAGKANVEKEGKTTVNAAKLKQTVDRIPRGVDVSLALDDNGNLIMKAGRSRVTFRTLPVEDFPVLKSDIGGASYAVSGADLVTLFSQSVHATATATTALAGVFLHTREYDRKPVLAAVGTTGTILILSTIPQPKGADQIPLNGGRPGALLSAATINAALQLFGAAEHVTVESDNLKIRFKTDSTCLTSCLLDGIYPDYERIITPPAEQKIIVDRDRAIASCNLLETFATKEQGHRLQCATSDDGLVLASGAAGGDAVDVTDADIVGEVEPFGLSGTFLKTVLGAFKSEMIVMHPDTANKRVLFMSDKDPSMMALIATMAIPTDLATDPKYA